MERADEPVEVLYGADIDTTITGSGFPQKVRCMLAGKKQSHHAHNCYALLHSPLSYLAAHQIEYSQASVAVEPFTTREVVC